MGCPAMDGDGALLEEVVVMVAWDRVRAEAMPTLDDGDDEVAPRCRDMAAWVHRVMISGLARDPRFLGTFIVVACRAAVAKDVQSYVRESWRESDGDDKDGDIIGGSEAIGLEAHSNRGRNWKRARSATPFIYPSYQSVYAHTPRFPDQLCIL